MTPTADDGGDEHRPAAPTDPDPDIVIAAACGAITLAELQGCDVTGR